LGRGERIVETLKQPQYVPMPVEEQVMIIYVATNGYLDDLPVSAVKKFEREFYIFMRDKYPDVGIQIKQTGKLSDENVETLKKAAVEFKGQFTP